MGRNVLLSVTVGLLAATLSVALPNLRVDIPGAEEEPVASEAIAASSKPR
jgi:hypothetical protein